MITPITFKKKKSTNKTSGWHENAPLLTSERKTLKEKCGSKCFLNPIENKFPICSKSIDCKKDCRGILSAKIRARQWKYTEIGNVADTLYQKLCIK